MKIDTKRLLRGANGVSFIDFLHVFQKRTHEKCVNAAYERKSDPTGASQ